MSRFIESQTVSSGDFRLEYDPSVENLALRADIESYLGEYRFQLPSYTYLLSIQDVEGKKHICDPYEFEPMTIKIERAIEKCEDRWENTSRERAEYQGMLQLENYLETARNGDILIWMSPPGSREEGYGDYGFVFVGEVATNADALLMTAYRVEKPTLDKFQTLTKMLDREVIIPTSAEEFLASPLHLFSRPFPLIEDELLKVFGYKDSFETAIMFQHALLALNPLIEKFIAMVQNGRPSHELKRTLDAIENYAIDLKQHFEKSSEKTAKEFVVDSREYSVDKLIAAYGFAPPSVAGSCPSKQNSNPFSTGSLLRNALGKTGNEVEDFECPNCHKKSTPPIGDNCPKCHITKEEAVEKGLVTC